MGPMPREIRPPNASASRRLVAAALRRYPAAGRTGRGTRPSARLSSEAASRTALRYRAGGRVRCRTRSRSERVRLPQLVTRSLAAKRVKTPPFWVSCFMWSAAQKVIVWMVSVGL